MLFGIPSHAWINLFAVLATMFGVFITVNHANNLKVHEKIPNRWVGIGCANIAALVLNLHMFAFTMFMQADLQQLKAQDMQGTVIESEVNHAKDYPS